MGHTLIISEKPSAALRIAQSLADGSVKKIGREKEAAYYEITRKGRTLVVAPAAGHLFILKESEPNHKWTYPVFSVRWEPGYLEKENAWSKKYFDNLKKVCSGADEIISACDYDIEGSVIAFNIIRFICKAKDGRRMRFSTLTDSDLVDAYENASRHLDFPQIEAGLTRHELDWYFGINLSRALTLALEHVGGYWVLSTGRVQGPTLKLLYEREREIAEFKPIPFWEIEIKCRVDGKGFTASHENDKFWKKEEASEIFNRCKGRHGRVSDIKKSEHKQHPPFPFDLTTLQRESYGLFGYSPKQTLDIAQSLYEQALISYPRTSSQKLPAKIGHRKILEDLARQKNYRELCSKLLAKKALRPNEGKKDDPAHPSIFPTGMEPKKLNNYQKRLYDLIVRRFLAVFGEPAIREQMRAEIKVGDDVFLAHGIRTLKPNWFEFYGPYLRLKEQVLPQMRISQDVMIDSIDMLDKETQPPNRYSQASILKEMEALNLGTKGTRALILQTLYDRGYIKEASINVTKLGASVIKELERHCPEIVSVDLTKQFESEIEAIENGRQKREAILENARKELNRILADFKLHEKDIGSGIKDAVREYEKELHRVGRCECGGDMMIIHSKKTGKRFVGCTSYPKCSHSFPLPQHGFLTVTSQECKNCGLFYVAVRNKGRRPWRLCVRCGFASSAKTSSAKKLPKAAAAKKAARPTAR